jgi:tape measure domain-containing protein
VLNLGTLRFGLGVDTTGLTAALRSVEAFGRTVQGAQVAANRGFETSIGMLRRQENTLLQGMERIRNMQEQINRSTLAPAIKTDLIRQANDLYGELARRVTSAASGLDPTKIDRASMAFGQAANDLIKGMQGADRAGREVVRTIERQEQAIHRAAEAARNLNENIQRSRAPGLGADASAARIGLMQRVDTATANFRSNMVANPAEAGRWRREWETAIGAVRRELGTLNTKAPDSAPWMRWKDAIHGLGQASLFASGHLGGMSTRMFVLSSLISSHGAAVGIAAGAVTGLGVAFTTLAQRAIESRLVLEKLTFALTAVTGNSTAAALQVEYLRKVSDQAGISVAAVGQSYMRMAASGKAAGMAQAEINRMFEVFSVASGTLSLSAEDAAGVFRALDQIMSKGTVQAEELRGQLGDRLPGAFAIAAQAMGVTTRELNKMMKDGEVISRDFLPKFTEQVRIAFGLDMSKNVDTLQASMQRLSNSWLFFGQAVDRSFGISNAWKGLLEALGSTLDSVANNMGNIAGILGGLAGAFAGVAAVMIAPMVWSAMAAGATAVGAAFMALRGITFSLIGAQMALYAVFATTPWGAIISLVVRLTAVIGAATIGFNLAQNAAASLQGALGDTSGISAYISGQKLALTSTLQTTQAMMNQVAVMQKTASSNFGAAQDALGRMQKGGAGQYVEDMFWAGKTGQFATPMRDIRKQRIADAQRKRDEARQEYLRLGGLGLDLQGIATRQAAMPPSAGMPIGTEDKGKPDKGSNKAANEAERAQEAVQKLQDTLAATRQAMDAMFVASPDFRRIDAITEARQQIQGMNENELNAMKAKLDMAGASTEDLVVALANIIEPTDRAKDAMTAFRSSMEAIDEGVLNLEGLKTSIDFLVRGGNPEDLWVVEAVNKAHDEIAKFKYLGPEGEKALEALRLRLAALGFTAATTADALAQFNKAQAEAARQARALEEVYKMEAEAAKDLERAQVLNEAYSRGDKVGKEAERMYEIADAVEKYRVEYEKLDAVQRQAHQTPEDFANTVAQISEAERQLERTKERMAELKDMWVSGFRDMYSAIIDVADGTKKLGEAVTDVFMGIVNRFAENAVNLLAEKSFDMLIGAMDPRGIAAGIVGGRKGNAGGTQAAAQATQQLAIAADFAAQALMKIAAMGGMVNGGMGGAGGGLGGIIGGLIKVGTAFFGGGGGYGAVANSAIYDSANAFMMGRAMGGPVTKGWGYEVNEQGTGGEIFFPSTSGFIANSNQLKGNSGTTIIDQRATIDARGATPDAIAMLKQEMLIRESRLRQQLPYAIDARVRDSRRRLRPQ